MKIQPYLFFEGRCEEAIEFYKQQLGAQVTMLMRYKDSPVPPSPEACAGSAAPPPGDKVMHASFTLGETEVMASDGLNSGQPGFQGISLSITASDAAHADRLFQGLSEGGKIQMPMGKTFFSPAFGMVADKFGVSWMVIVPE